MQEGLDAAEDNSLPEIALFNNFNRAFAAYSKIRATDWHFLPNGPALDDQDEAEWQDIMLIDAIVRKLEKLFEKK